MIENILTVGNYVLILFILIAIGFAANKTKVLTRAGAKEMTDFVLYIVTPCVIINSYQRAFDPTMLKGLMITVIAAVLSFAANIALAHLLIRDKEKSREKVLRFAAVFSNCGYMSLPLQSAMLGDEGVFYGATYLAVFQVVLWTYGVILMSGDAKQISLKNIFINPGVIGTILGLLVFVFSVEIPFTVSEPIRFLAALNTPIPMVIVGFHLAGSSLKVKGKNVWLSMILRLIVSPLLVILGFYACGISGTVPIACTIAVAASTAAATAMFSEKFGADTELSATVVSVTTLLSIITMPIMVGIAAVL